jgi:hypothetical protein
LPSIVAGAIFRAIYGAAYIPHLYAFAHIDELSERQARAVIEALPPAFPIELASSVLAGIKHRLCLLADGQPADMAPV